MNEREPTCLGCGGTIPEHDALLRCPPVCPRCNGLRPVGDFLARCGPGITTLCNCASAADVIPCAACDDLKGCILSRECARGVQQPAPTLGNGGNFTPGPTHAKPPAPAAPPPIAGVRASDTTERHLREIRNYIKAAGVGGIEAEWLAALDDALGVRTVEAQSFDQLRDLYLRARKLWSGYMAGRGNFTQDRALRAEEEFLDAMKAALAHGVEGLACTSCDCSTPVGKAADCKWGWECQAWRDARRDPNYASGVRRDDDGYLTAVYELLQIPELCRTPDLLMERVLDLQRKAAVAGYRAALESSGRDVLQRAIAALRMAVANTDRQFSNWRKVIEPYEASIAELEASLGVASVSPAQNQTRNEGARDA